MSDIYDEYREAPQGCGGTMIGIAGIIIIIVLLLVGCKTQYIAGQDTERIVEVHHHDTTIVTEADSASAMALLECDSAYNVVVRELTIEQGKRIKADVKTQGVSNGVSNQLLLAFDCKEDSLMQVIAWQDSIIRTTTTQTIVKVEKQKDFVWYTGIAFIVIICLVFVWQVAKVVLKFYGVKI
jgi:hypothetical protein